MTGPYATAIIVVSLLLALWSLVLVVVNRPPNAALVAAGLLLELLLVVFAVGGIIQMAGSDRDFARAEFVGYLVALAAIVPAALWWMRGETTRAASGVMAVVFLIVPFLVLRVQQVWAGLGA